MRVDRDPRENVHIPDRHIIVAMAVVMLVRQLMAAVIPLGNDEVYYWDWGRDLQLSYFDHPPGVSWLSAGAQAVFMPWAEGLAARGLVPPVSFLTGMCLFVTYREIAGVRRNLLSDLTFLCLTQLVPAFAIGGFLLLPDAGLMLAASAGMLLTLRFAKRENSLKVACGLSLGAVAGVAGLFKYHAAPIFGGMLLGLAISRKARITKELPFWITLVVTGIVVTLPVWIWNARNDMASFVFQASRGVSGAQMDLPRAMRTIAGEIVFLTPAFFGLLLLAVVTLWRHRRRDTERIVLLATAPLLILVHVTMTYKEVLPHWGLPAFWLLVPDAAIMAGQRWSVKKLRLNAIVAATVTALIVTITGVPPVRERLIGLAGGKPGALGELTFWPMFPTSPAWQDIKEKTASVFTRERPKHCQSQPVMASYRWFTVAHLAWSLPDNPVVRSFEGGSRYYYHDRDRNLDLAGCPVIAIGEKAHANPDAIDQSMEVLATGEVVDGRYLDRPITWSAGYLR